jgi:hypothetical protein
MERVKNYNLKSLRSENPALFISNFNLIPFLFYPKLLRSTPSSKKIRDFSQALRLLQELQFLQLNTWLVSLSILYRVFFVVC